VAHKRAFPSTTIAGFAGSAEKKEEKKKKKEKKKEIDQPTKTSHCIFYGVFGHPCDLGAYGEGCSGICFQVTELEYRQRTVKCSTLTADGPQKLLAGCNASQSEFPIKRI